MVDYLDDLDHLLVDGLGLDYVSIDDLLIDDLDDISVDGLDDLDVLPDVWHAIKKKKEVRCNFSHIADNTVKKE